MLTVEQAPMVTSIASARLRLRAPRIDDLRDYMAYRNDASSLVAQAMDAIDEDGARDFLVDQSRLDDDAFGWRMFAVERLDRPGMIGEVGVFTSEDDPRQGDLGWWLHADHRGRGYAAEAVAALVEWCFVECDFHRVTASCLSTNIASRNTMRRIGMRLERRSIESRLSGGYWHDEAGYALLRREWEVRPMPRITPEDDGF